ncbi:MAG: ferrochelatase [Chlorobi bacterium]|nr:ferrochelatase [Chlorobiota bacterium]
MQKQKKIAVILAAHGEAESTGFRENYRVSYRTLQHASTVMALPSILRAGISLLSSVRKKIGRSASGSPHNRITRQQAESLQRYLDSCYRSSGVSFEVHAAFSASDPPVEGVIDATSHYDARILVSMSPSDNELTCGQLCGYLAENLAGNDLSRVKVISRFWNDPVLYDLYTGHIVAESAEHGLLRSNANILLLLFHGTLVSNSRGEPPRFRTGRQETAHFAEQLTGAIGKDATHPYGRVMTAYLNHAVGGEWTKPAFEEVAGQLRKSGATNVALFAAGYFADGNETLHRAEELLRMTSSSCTVRTIPSMNESPAFTRYLGQRVAGAASQILFRPFP